MFNHGMAVQQNGFHLGEQRIIAIQISPACLHHPDLFILEVRDAAPKKIGSRNKVGVEDRHELALRRFQPVLKSAGLIAPTVGAIDITDWKTWRSQEG